MSEASAILLPGNPAAHLQKYKVAWDLLLNLPNVGPYDKAQAKAWLTYRVIDGEVPISDWIKQISPVVPDVTGWAKVRWDISQRAAETYMWLLRGRNQEEKDRWIACADSVIESAGSLPEHPPSVQAWIMVAFMRTFYRWTKKDDDMAKEFLIRISELWHSIFLNTDFKDHPLRYSEAHGDLNIMQGICFLMEKLGMLTIPKVEWMTVEKLFDKSKGMPWVKCIRALQTQERRFEKLPAPVVDYSGATDGCPRYCDDGNCCPPTDSEGVTKAIFLNDQSGYHAGSTAVTRNLKRLALESRIELVPFQYGMKTEPSQLVVINGEGTMHHGALLALTLHERAVELKQAGCRIILLNTVLQDMDIDYSVYDRIVTREGRSAKYAKKKGARCVEIIPDLSFCSKIPEASVERRGILFIDSTADAYSRMISEVADEHESPTLKMREWQGSFEELVLLMRGKELVVTGRFHGAVSAMLAGTPVLAMPSNTWKTNGMMDDFCIGQNYHSNDKTLRKAIGEKRWAMPDVDKIAAIPGQWKTFLDSLNPRLK